VFQVRRVNTFKIKRRDAFMIQSLRKRVNATTVIAVFALVFAMTGGAYAAKKFLITSTGQISPKVLKSLKGSAGAKGASGANGAPGAQGPAGAAGPQGPAGAAGAAGAKGEDGKDGAKGEQGIPGTTGFTATLPSGKTETGTWAASQESVNYGSPAAASFAIPLAAGLDGEHVHLQPPEEETEKVEEFEQTCPGSAEAPKATPGNFCVYVGLLRHLALLEVNPPSSPGTETGTGTSGAIIRLSPLGEEPTAATAWGDWAVTAP
jgi:hypothetical protein